MISFDSVVAVVDVNVGDVPARGPVARVAKARVADDLAAWRVDVNSGVEVVLDPAAANHARRDIYSPVAVVFKVAIAHGATKRVDAGARIVAGFTINNLAVARANSETLIVYRPAISQNAFVD